MRHILILLSILLLSSPVIGEETGVLYYWKRSSGDVWKTFGDDNTHPKYVGEIKNDKPNGLGILYNGSPNYDGTFDFYIWKGIKFVGSWKNGKPHGKNAIGITSAGGKIRDKLVTVKAEKPKPLYPRMKAATLIASTAYSNIAGLRPNNSCHSICI